MEILCSVAVGAAAGGLAILVCKPGEFHFTTSLAVGILGGLLGLALDFWLTAGGLAPLPFSKVLASSTGAGIALALWIVAQRLFLSEAPEQATGDENRPTIA